MRDPIVEEVSLAEKLEAIRARIQHSSEQAERGELIEGEEAVADVKRRARARLAARRTQ